MHCSYLESQPSQDSVGGHLSDTQLYYLTPITSSHRACYVQVLYSEYWKVTFQKLLPQRD